MGISSTVGLMSGLDIEGIIKATMDVERSPIFRLQSDQAAFQAKISSYGSLKGVLSSLNSAVSSLANPDTFAAGYSASTSNSEMLTVKASDSASAGTFQIKVNQLATSAQMTSNTYLESDSDVGAGTLHFRVGDGEKQSVDISSDDQSLSGIATAINEANLDVTASVLKVADNDYRITLTAKDTGKDIDFTFQEEGFTFSTTEQASDSTGETMESQQFDSDTTALGITGTLSVNGTDIALTGTETLNDIQASVDALADISATVNFDADSGQYTLDIENDIAEGNVTLNFSDSDATGGFSELIDDVATIAAQLANLTVNNIEGVTRESNSISDLITGVTINLIDEDLEETITVGVTSNYDNAKTKIEKLVESYNSAITTIESLQKYNSDTGKAANLLGDSTTNVLKSGLRRMLFSSVNGAEESVNSLSNLGIELQESGQLKFDSGTFTTLMKSNASDITDFFTQETYGAEGLAVKFENFLSGYIGSDGVLAAKEEGYNNSISRMDDNILAIERRLSKREDNLRQRYMHLEELMSGFMSTSQYMSNQLTTLSNMTSSFYK